SDEALREAASAYRRIENFVERAAERLNVLGTSAEVPAEFAAAMDDDLNTSRALGAVHDAVRDGNAALAAGDDAAAIEALATVGAMLDVLGIDPRSPQWSGQ